MPKETLERLASLDVPTDFLHGNGDLAVLAQMTASSPDGVTYWGSSSTAPLPEPIKEMIRWTARQLDPDSRKLLASWPKTVTLEIDGPGQVLFCHATPRNETEVFTRLTVEEKLVPVFAGVSGSLVVCGHSHMQFDRMVGPIRVLNAEIGRASCRERV